MNAYSVRCAFAQDALDLIHEMLVIGIKCEHVQIDMDGPQVRLEFRADVNTAELRRTIRRAPHGLYIAQTLQTIRTPKTTVAPRVSLALPWRENTQCGDREL